MEKDINMLREFDVEGYVALMLITILIWESDRGY